MPEPTDPANARLALRRLVSTFLVKDDDPVDVLGIDDLLSRLDSDEMADYEQVVAALSGLAEVPRFGVIDWNGFAVVDMSAALDPHTSGRVTVLVGGEEHTMVALAATLNAHPDTWAEALAAAPEPF